MNNLYTCYPGPLNKVLLNHNDFYPKYGAQHAYPYGYNTYSSNLSISKAWVV